MRNHNLVRNVRRFDASSRLLILMGMFIAGNFYGASAQVVVAEAQVDAAIVGTWRLPLPGKQGSTLIVWTINADGQYRMTFQGPDQKPEETGKVHIADGKWASKSDAGKVLQGSYDQRDAETLAVKMGGQQAFWLRLDGAKAATQPAAVVGNEVDAVMVGTWRTELPGNGGSTLIVWTIEASGNYRLAFDGATKKPVETGKVHFADGHWNSKTEAGKTYQGTYTQTDNDTASITGATGAAIWLRGSIAAPTPAPVVVQKPVVKLPPAPRPAAVPAAQPEPLAKTPAPTVPTPPPVAAAAAPPTAELATALMSQDQKRVLQSTVSVMPPATEPDFGPTRPAGATEKMVAEVQTVGDAIDLERSGIVLSPDRKHYIDGRNSSTEIEGQKISFPAGYANAFFTVDSKHVYCTVTRSMTYAYDIDGKVGPFFRNVFSIVISPDASRFAYIGFDGKTNYSVVTDAGASDLVYTSVETPVLSPDGRHIAILAKKGRQVAVVFLDGKELGNYDAVERSTSVLGKQQTFVFSPDSQHLAFAAFDKGKRYIFLDSRQGPLATDGTGPMFSSNGKHFGYAIGKPVPHVVVDGVEGSAYNGLASFSFSPDGAHYAYVARQKKDNFVVLDGKEGKAYSQIGFTGQQPTSMALRWSADGSTLAYMAVDGKRPVLVENDKEIEPTDQVMDIKLSDDGKHMAYSATRRGGQYVVLDGTQGEVFQEVKNLTFTFMPRSALLVYDVIKRSGNTSDLWRVVDSDKGPVLNRPSGEMTYSSGGEHYAYVTHSATEGLKVGRQTVIIDGRAGPVFDRVENPVFSKDGKHWAYMAFNTQQVEGSSKSVASVAVDDEIGSPFDSVIRPGTGVSDTGLNSVIGPWAFDDADRFQVYATQSESLLRVTYRPLRSGEAEPTVKKTTGPSLADSDAPVEGADNGPPKLPTLTAAANTPVAMGDDERVDPAIIGAWRTARDGNASLGWTIQANGHYRLWTEKMNPDDAEARGTAHFKQGKWEARNGLNGERSQGTYTAIDDVTMSTVQNGQTTIWFRCMHSIAPLTYIMPKAVPGGIDPIIVGTWRYQNTVADGIEIVTMVIHADGQFRRGYGGVSKKPDETGKIHTAQYAWSSVTDAGTTEHGTYAIRDQDGLAVIVANPADANRAAPPPGFLPGVQSNHDTIQTWLRYQPAPKPPVP